LLLLERQHLKQHSDKFNYRLLNNSYKSLNFKFNYKSLHNKLNNLLNKNKADKKKRKKKKRKKKKKFLKTMVLIEEIKKNRNKFKCQHNKRMFLINNLAIILN